jgi:hypothetical protein
MMVNHQILGILGVGFWDGHPSDTGSQYSLSPTIHHHVWITVGYPGFIHAYSKCGQVTLNPWSLSR